MNERIKEIRKELGLTQQAFADKIGVKRNTVALYELGESGISDSVIKLICKEFHINETWLRTGEGEMRKALSREAEIFDYLEGVFDDEDEFRKNFFYALAKLDLNDWKKISDFIDTLKKGC